MYLEHFQNLTPCDWPGPKICSFQFQFQYACSDEIYAMFCTCLICTSSAIDHTSTKIFLVRPDEDRFVYITSEGCRYTTSTKQPRFGNMLKFLSIVHMKISNPDSDQNPNFSRVMFFLHCWRLRCRFLWQCKV